MWGSLRASASSSTVSAGASERGSKHGGFAVKCPKLSANDRLPVRAPASAPPSVPDDTAKAVPVFLPKLGPEITESIGFPSWQSTSASLVKMPMLAHDEGDYRVSHR